MGKIHSLREAILLLSLAIPSTNTGTITIIVAATPLLPPSPPPPVEFGGQEVELVILGQTVAKGNPARDRGPGRAASYRAHDGLEMVGVELELSGAAKREGDRVLGAAGVVGE